MWTPNQPHDCLIEANSPITINDLERPSSIFKGLWEIKKRYQNFLFLWVVYNVLLQNRIRCDLRNFGTNWPEMHLGPLLFHIYTISYTISICNIQSIYDINTNTIRFYPLWKILCQLWASWLTLVSSISYPQNTSSILYHNI